MATMQHRRWPWGRIVAGVVAGAIFLLAVPLLFSGAEIRRQLDAARIAEPIHLKVDLSKPGAYSGDFHHTFIGAHSNFLQIVPESPFPSHEKAVAVIEGMQGHYSMIEPHGTVVHQQRFGPTGFDAVQVESNRWVPILGFDRFGFDEGVYKMKLTVDRGAPRLGGVSHAIVGRYDLCGVEYVAATIIPMYGVAGCVIAGIIVLVIVVVTLRKRSLSASPAPSERV